jgi:hypothetical protein
MAKENKKPNRLTKAMLETANDMRQAGQQRRSPGKMCEYKT